MICIWPGGEERVKDRRTMRLPSEAAPIARQRLVVPEREEERVAKGDLDSEGLESLFMVGRQVRVE